MGNANGDSYNAELMTKIKEQLRTPTSSQEIMDTNNGYTNFDGALDKAVEYFQTEATPGRLNLMVFLSDGVPTVRGDGDQEGYCAEMVAPFFDRATNYVCADLGYAPGAPHTICRGNDSNCVNNNPYQECVRGNEQCHNADATMQYTSELNALDEMEVARLAIGVGEESNVTDGSAL